MLECNLASVAGMGDPAFREPTAYEQGSWERRPRAHASERWLASSRAPSLAQGIVSQGTPGGFRMASPSQAS